MAEKILTFWYQQWKFSIFFFLRFSLCFSHDFIICNIQQWFLSHMEIFSLFIARKKINKYENKKIHLLYFYLQNVRNGLSFGMYYCRLFHFCLNRRFNFWEKEKEKNMKYVKMLTKKNHCIVAAFFCAAVFPLLLFQPKKKEENSKWKK